LIALYKGDRQMMRVEGLFGNALQGFERLAAFS